LDPDRCVALLAENPVLLVAFDSCDGFIAKIAIEICRNISESDPGAIVLMQTGVVTQLLAIGSESGYELWKEAMLVVCSVVSSACGADVLAVLEMEEFVDVLCAVLEEGDDEQVGLALKAIQTIMLQTDGVATLGRFDRLLDALATLGECDRKIGTVAQYVAERIMGNVSD
jgi:hypothetical protein